RPSPAIDQAQTGHGAGVGVGVSNMPTEGDIAKLADYYLLDQRTDDVLRHGFCCVLPGLPHVRGGGESSLHDGCKLILRDKANRPSEEPLVRRAVVLDQP